MSAVFGHVPAVKERFLFRRLFGGLVILAAIILSGCAETPERLWLKAPGWSRAEHVGDTATGDAPVFALTPDGVVAFLGVGNRSGRYFPEAVAVDQKGQPVWKKSFASISMARPDAPSVYWAHNAFQLFWISNKSLFHAELEPTSGEMAASPQKLSGEHRVQSYSVAIDQQGRIVVWFAGPRSNPGLYRLPADELTAEPVLIDGVGVTPTLRYDTSGTLHAVWAQHPMGETNVTFLYSATDSDAVTLDDARIVVRTKSAVGSILAGPIMGINATDAYLFWTIEVRTGLAAGSVDTRYIFFPLGRPQEASAATQLFIPSDYHLPYQDWLDEGFHAGKRSPLAPPLTSKITQLYANSAPGPELVTIQRQLVAYTMRDTRFQTGALFFRDGHPDSYQLFSFTGGNSSAPYITHDADGYLYAAWLERGSEEGFRIVYANTHPVMVSAQRKLSAQDYLSLLMQTLFGLLSGAILLPFSLMWIIAPVIMYAITFPLRRSDTELRSPGVFVSLSLALASFWIIKLIMLGGISSYTPFSAWIPIIPGWMTHPLQIGVPLFTFLFGIWVAWYYTYYRQTYSSLLFLIIYLAVDSIISTAVYGPIFLATN
ncbi:MAG: hypothetical protein DSY55_04490 [Clostridia bacterium]|nr:MAG: hypothetical protein DSY55_04490 [Clostridia bacterium]